MERATKLNRAGESHKRAPFWRSRREVPRSLSTPADRALAVCRAPSTRMVRFDAIRTPREDAGTSSGAHAARGYRLGERSLRPRNRQPVREVERGARAEGRRVAMPELIVLHVARVHVAGERDRGLSATWKGRRARARREGDAHADESAVDAQEAVARQRAETAGLLRVALDVDAGHVVRQVRSREHERVRAD